MPEPVVCNRETPPRVPVRPQGRIEVIARLELDTGRGPDEVWVPATAIRWTRTHVLVTWRPDPAAGRTATCWLRAGDVARTVRPRTPWPGPPQRQRPGATPPGGWSAGGDRASHPGPAGTAGPGG